MQSLYDNIPMWATELTESFLDTLQWPEHSEQIAGRHYRRVTDSHYARAVNAKAEPPEAPEIPPYSPHY